MREYMKTVLNGLKQQIGNIKIPKVLPNPHSLRLTGAVEATYDGSEAVEVEIPQGGEQPDWNQNDTTAPGYIKNRTHYMTDPVTLVSEASASLYLPTSNSKVVDMGVDFVAGVQYHITMRDVKMSEPFLDGNYKCVETEKGLAIRIPTADVDFNAIYGTNSTSATEWLFYNLNGALYIEYSGATSGFDMQINMVMSVSGPSVKPLDIKYLPDEVVNRKPLLLNADMAETYLNDSSYGDAALEAIKDGKEILVRVPNADGGNYTAIYSPVLMHQVPNYQNNYLYLFFLRDEKQDLSALLGQPAGTVLMPVYGQLKMLLSQEYNSDPLEV